MSTSRASIITSLCVVGGQALHDVGIISENCQAFRARAFSRQRSPSLMIPGARSLSVFLPTGTLSCHSFQLLFKKKRKSQRSMRLMPEVYENSTEARRPGPGFVRSIVLIVPREAGTPQTSQAVSHNVPDRVRCRLGCLDTISVQGGPMSDPTLARSD